MSSLILGSDYSKPRAQNQQKNNSPILPTLLYDLPKLKQYKNLTANYYTDLQIYCLLLSNQLSFYFIKENRVKAYFYLFNPFLQIIHTVLPFQIDIPTIKNVFVQRIPLEFQVGGHFVVAFGHHSYILLHLNPEEDNDNNYTILGIKPITSISPDNTNDLISIVEQVDSDQQPMQRSNITYSRFVIGCQGNQKLIELTIQLAKHLDKASSVSLVFNSQDRIIHQLQQSIKQRVSNFFTSKLGFQQQDNTSQRVLDIQSIGGVLALFTQKDIIFVSSIDGTKLFQIGFMEELQDIELEFEAKNGDLGMRELLELRYLSHNLQTYKDEIVINIFNVRVQIDRKSYQASKQTDFILQSFYIKEEDGDIKFSQPSRSIFIDVPEAYQMDDIIKSFSLQFSLLGTESRCILGVESNEGRNMLIEVSKDKKLTNFSTISQSRLLGYSTYQGREGAAELTLISADDIQFYNFDAHTYLDLKQTPPNTLKAEVQEVQGLIVDMPLRQPEYEPQIINKEHLRTYLFGLLEEFANWYGLEQLKSESGIPRDISQRLSKLFSTVSQVTVIEDLKSIIIDSLDQQLSVNLFTGARDQQEQLLFSDDGLILSTLETKEKKLDIIKNFIIHFNLQKMDQPTPIMAFIDAMQINLTTAKLLRKFQESLKEQMQRNRAQSLRGSGPLEVRLLNAAIQRTADKFNFNENALKQRGTTALNVVFSFITQFDQMIYTLMNTCLVSNSQNFLDISQAEDKFDVTAAGIKVLTPILEEIIGIIRKDQLDIFSLYVRRLDFLENVFEMITVLSDGIAAKIENGYLKTVLMQFSDLFIRLMCVLELDEQEKFAVWKNNIVLFFERRIGIREAIAFAEKYRAPELLCRLVFEGGKEYYPVLHKCIDSWGQGFDMQAIRIIYSQEQNRVRTSLNGQPLSAIKTVDRQNYPGFTLFDIFEKTHFGALSEFLKKRNPKLHAILILRQKQTEAYSQAEEVFKQKIPTSQLNDTVKVFGSLANMNSQRFVDTKFQEYYQTKVKLADLTQRYSENDPQVFKVNSPFLDKTLQTNLNQGMPLLDALKFQCQLLDLAFFDLPPDLFAQLNEKVWQQIVQRDSVNIRQAQSMLPGQQVADIYTEKEIKDQVEKCLLYKLGKLQYQNLCVLDEGVRQYLVVENQQLAAGLNLVFRLLDTQNIHTALFSTNYQSPFKGYSQEQQDEESQMSESHMIQT